MSLFQVEGLVKRFGALLATDHVTLNVEAGEIHALIGPNGAGKSTFFNMVSGVDDPSEGQVQLMGVGASVAGNFMAKNPQVSTEFKLLLKDSPNYIGVAKGEDKLRLRVNEIIAEARKSGDIDKLSSKWLGRPLGDLPS